MGVILDSTVLIAAERSERPVGSILEELASGLGDSDLSMSVISVAELSHGASRAKTELLRTQRKLFLSSLINLLPVYPVTLEVAMVAGELHGQASSKGSVCCCQTCSSV